MRLLWWLPLLGFLATASARDAQGSMGRSQSTSIIYLMASPFLSSQSRTAQDTLEALTDLASVSRADDAQLEYVSPEQESVDASHKQVNGGLLEAVQSVVYSLSGQTEEPQPPETSEPSPPSPTNPTDQEEEEEEGEGEGEEAAGVVKDAAGVEDPTDTTEPEVEEETPEEEKPKTKGERKAIQQYNSVADQVLEILSVTLKKVDPIPVTVDARALEALEEEVEEPEPVEEVEPENKKKKKKNRKNKNKRKRGESTDDEEEAEEEVEGGLRKWKNNNNNKRKNKNNNNNNKRKRNKNKRNKRKKNKKNSEGEEEEEEEQVEETGKKNKRNNNKNRRNKNKNNKRNKNKNNRAEGIELHRDGKALFAEGEEETSLIVGQEQGRRKTSKRNNKGGKNKRNRGNKNKRNKNKNNKRKGDRGRMDLEEEDVVETGPVYPTDEEKAAANAVLGGLTRLARVDDVTLERTTNRDVFTARVAVGPLAVQWNQRDRAIRKSSVTADLFADISFRIKTKGRRMQVIKVKEVTMGDLTSEKVNVARSDIDLEPEVITEAKNVVLGAVDVARIGRIINSELEAIFSEDDSVQNLSNHKLLEN